MINNITSTVQNSTTVSTSTSQKAAPEADSFLGILQATFKLSVRVQQDNIQNTSTDKDDNIGYFVSLDTVNNNIKRNHLKLTDAIEQTLEKEGIRKYPDFEIFADNDGMLFINSDRQDKEKIEKILNHTSTIKETFQEMAENISQAAAMERIQRLAYQHAADPQNALKQYYSVNKGDPEDTFSLKVTEKKYTPELYSYGKIEYLHVFDEIAKGNYDNNYNHTLETVTAPLQ